MTGRTTKPRKSAHAERDEANRKLINLLDSWLNVDEEGAQEQRETMQYLRQALDENRLPGSKLFS